MIPKSECKDRRLYRLKSRNLALGVWCAKSGGFIGLRTKFDSTYPTTEYHWEQGAPHGTAQPQEELPDDLPANVPLTERLDGSLCSECGAPATYLRWPEGGEREVSLDGEKRKVPGVWQHLDGTRCECMYGYVRTNKELETWLYAMQAKYPEPKRETWADLAQARAT